jgi:hypothetical protein
VDGSHFDHLTRAFRTLQTRRAVTQVLAGILAGEAAQAVPVSAKRKKHKKPCKAPKQKCGGKCLSVLTDDRNCGACGNRCGDGQSCRNGECKGTPNPQECLPGACCEDNQACGTDGRCRGGVCQPKPTCHANGETFPATDTTPCCSENTASNAGTTGVEITCLPGELGNPCLADGDCRSGSCIGYQCVGCSAGEGVCNGRCVSLSSQSNCGACGNACARGSYCQGGSCALRYVLDLQWPVGACDDVYSTSDGAVFIAFSGQHCVREYSGTGQVRRTYGVCGTPGTDNSHLKNPRAVAADAFYVYVADYDNDRIQIFSRTMNSSAIGRIGNGSGNGDNQFRGPNDIAFDADGNIYVADYVNDRVQKFSDAGAHLLTFGGSGTGNGQIQGATGVAVDRHGNVYVSDRIGIRVQKFDSAGHFLDKYGTLGHAPGEINLPLDVEVASNDDVFIGDYFNGRIQQFTRNWNLVRIFEGTPLTGPRSIHVDENDNVYIADVNYGVVRYRLMASSPS